MILSLHLNRYMLIPIFIVLILDVLKELLTKGHGEYREIPSEKDFFSEVKESEKVVCHFYRNSTSR